MSITFRPGVRERVPLLIGLIGSSGSGKTFSALRLATGIVGDKPFAVIDTEGRRALSYAPVAGAEPDYKTTFRFEHADLRAPFRPETYAEAIKAADAAGFPVIVVDSFSHEHAGEGGILDWQEDELTRMAGDDFRKRESCKMASWIKPKMAHKQMVQQLLQVRAHLILCFRAEEKTRVSNPYKDAMLAWNLIPHSEGDKEPVPSDKLPNKMVIEPMGWQPICEKNLPYELTVSLLLTPEAPGIPKPLKLQAQHRALFPLNEKIGETAGKRLAEWAIGGAAPAPKPAADGPKITEDQVTVLMDACEAAGITVDDVKKNGKLEKLGDLTVERYQKTLAWIAGQKKGGKNAETP